MSVHERVEWLQEKDPRHVYGEFSVDPKSCVNVPISAYEDPSRKLRIMKSADDE